MEAIILAGGLGTRLRSLVAEVPKSMALIQGIPFLEYQIDQMIRYGVKKIIISVGYKAECIAEHFQSEYKGCKIVYALEDKKLGTGGAIKNAMKFVTNEHVIVANGDSMFKVDLCAEMEHHLESLADVTLALKPMKNFERYGSIKINSSNKIVEFLEKQKVKEGLINGGLYIFNVDTFRSNNLPEVFSIEKEYFEEKVTELHFSGFISDTYFLDIGIPKDYLKSQFEIGLFPKIDKTWTLNLLNSSINDSNTLLEYFGKINQVSSVETKNKTIYVELSSENCDALVYRTVSIQDLIETLKQTTT